MEPIKCWVVWFECPSARSQSGPCLDANGPSLFSSQNRAAAKAKCWSDKAAELGLGDTYTAVPATLTIVPTPTPEAEK